MKRLLPPTVLLASATLFAQSPFDGTWKAKPDPEKFPAESAGYALRCTNDAFSAESPLGGWYVAKFDGNFYPLEVEGDPAHTMISVKRVNARTVEITSQRKGKIAIISRLTVAPDGNSIHGILENKESDTKSSFDWEKQK